VYQASTPREVAARRRATAQAPQRRRAGRGDRGVRAAPRRAHADARPTAL